MMSVRILAILCALIGINLGQQLYNNNNISNRQQFQKYQRNVLSFLNGVRNRRNQGITGVNNGFSQNTRNSQQGNILYNGRRGKFDRNVSRRWQSPTNTQMRAIQQFRNHVGNSAVQQQPNILHARSMMRLMKFVNKHRSQVDATNMFTMKWNNQLAVKAAQRSSTCQFIHLADAQGETLDIIPPEFRGNNMVDFVMKHWYAEKNDFRIGQDCRITNTCKYSQMIWARSKEMGCASHWCAKHQLFVCLFNEPGNVPHQLPFVQGNHCDACPNRCVDQLCTEYQRPRI